MPCSLFIAGPRFFHHRRLCHIAAAAPTGPHSRHEYSGFNFVSCKFLRGSLKILKPNRTRPTFMRNSLQSGNRHRISMFFLLFVFPFHFKRTNKHRSHHKFINHRREREGIGHTCRVALVMVIWQRSIVGTPRTLVNSTFRLTYFRGDLAVYSWERKILVPKYLKMYLYIYR